MAKQRYTLRFSTKLGDYVSSTKKRAGALGLHTPSVTHENNMVRKKLEL